LYETANVFNRFYREERVLNAPTESDKARRLALVEATARVLEQGFELLGIQPLDRM
jgi:arginyl-tRNA synthetase